MSVYYNITDFYWPPNLLNAQDDLYQVTGCLSFGEIPPNLLLKSKKIYQKKRKSDSPA